MLTVQDSWDAYYRHSTAASSNVRKLGFTGIALVWIFSGGGLGNASEVTISGHFEWPLYLLVFALAVDFAQYVYLSAAWRCFARYQEKRVKPEDLFLAPDWISVPGEVLFAMKVALVAVGYVWLLVTLYQQLLG